MRKGQCRQLELEAEYHGNDALLSPDVKFTRLSKDALAICEAAVVRLNRPEDLTCAVDFWLTHGRNRTAKESPKLDDAVQEFIQEIEDGAVVPYTVLCLFGCLRPTEAARMKWEDIDVDAREITIRGEVATRGAVQDPAAAAGADHTQARGLEYQVVAVLLDALADDSERHLWMGKADAVALELSRRLQRQITAKCVANARDRVRRLKR